MPSSAAILKARKILGLPQQPKPRKYCVKPIRTSTQSKSKYSLSASSSKSISNSKDFSFCKTSAVKSSLFNASGLKKKQSNLSFTSPYGRQTRYDKIMKIKVKSGNHSIVKNEKSRKDILSRSFSFNGSSVEENKENKSKNKTKVSRLDKIMQIKITKPAVPSTLQHYQPRKGSKSIPKETKQNAIKQWKQCQAKIKKSKQQQQKQDRLWKVFERQRQMRSKLKKAAQQREFQQQRRRQVRFEGMVVKQVQKIQKQREISRRRVEGFSHYLYPSY